MPPLSADQAYANVLAALPIIFGAVKAWQTFQAGRGKKEGDQVKQDAESAKPIDPCADEKRIIATLREENERHCKELDAKDAKINDLQERVDDLYGKLMLCRDVNHDVKGAARGLLRRATDAGADCEDIERKLSEIDDIKW